MFVTQQIVPRRKEWLPLATNQLRLRNLIQILAFSLRHDTENSVNMSGLKATDDQKPRSESYYYTLHSTAMSAPFYTSEKVSSDSPKWKEIEVHSFIGKISNSADAFVIRLWSTNQDHNAKEETEDVVIAIWGVYLNGLTYIGPNLGSDIPLKPNSIVFLMPGGYFTDINCLDAKPKIRYTAVSVSQSDIQPSYTVNTLTRLHTIQQVIKKELAEVDLLKQKISMGDIFRSETRGRTMLRKLLNKNKPKISHQEYIRVKENIEVAKYRVFLLTEEKSILSSKLKELKARIEALSHENQLMESRIMENYRVLMKKVQIQRELKRDHISKRESQLHSKAKLNFRAKQLISELNLIYPIIEKTPEKYTICGVHLPNSEDFTGHNELQIAVALGFVTHVIQMISVFLQVPLRYPVIHLGSRSRIVDHISHEISESGREFPLYLQRHNKPHFSYAVYLLNKNIAQLRWLCGLPTKDLRKTLSNLSSLVKMKSDNSNLDHCNRSISSSTADVCSSCLSVSSPVGSVLSFSNKKSVKGHKMSESGADEALVVLTPPFKQVTGHRISKSVGSAKDLMMSFSTKNPQEKHNNSTVGDNGNVSNLSYSLDKGLNEFGGSRSKNLAVNHVESHPFLTTSTSKELRIDFSESKEKEKFLQVWEVNKNSVPFSDDDSDPHSCDFRGNKYVPPAEGQKGLDKTDVHIGSCGESGPENEKAEESGRSSNDVDYMEEGIVAEEVKAEEETATKTTQGELNCDRNILSNSDVKKCDEETCVIVTDNLLENVTTRTEALANQTTSFNRFRSRFNSTVENSS